jgi:hypothetical protein
MTIEEKSRLVGSVQRDVYDDYAEPAATDTKPSFLRPFIFSLIAALGPLAFGCV